MDNVLKAIWIDRIAGAALWFGIGFVCAVLVCSFYEANKHHPRAYSTEEMEWQKQAALKTGVLFGLIFMVAWVIHHENTMLQKL